MKRNTIIILVSVLIIAGIYGLIQVVPDGKDRKSGVVQTDIASLRDLKSVVPATGEVLPLLSSIVKSEISGRITRILVEEGDSVQRGDVLVELDRISLQARVREAERSFEADRLRLERSKRNYERLKELHTKKFVGEKEFLDAKTDFKLSELNLEIAQARLEDAEEERPGEHLEVATLLPQRTDGCLPSASRTPRGTRASLLERMTRQRPYNQKC